MEEVSGYFIGHEVPGYFSCCVIFLASSMSRKHELISAILLVFWENCEGQKIIWLLDLWIDRLNNKDFNEIIPLNFYCDILRRNYRKLLLQSWTNCMRQTLVFMWNSAIRENFNFYFSAVFFWRFEIFLIFPNFQRSYIKIYQNISYIKIKFNIFLSNRNFLLPTIFHYK